MKAYTDFILPEETDFSIVSHGHNQAVQLDQRSRLSELWNRFLMALSSSKEPHVWQTHDRSGKLFWNAYDPMMDRSVCFASEQEMRQWIEARYYF